MKILTMIAAVFVAVCALAMPTNEEIEKAGSEVQTRLQKQLVKWLDGQMSDAEMAKLQLVMADKEKEEARHYVYLQAAFAAFARAGDADAATKALGRLRAETKGFTTEIEKAVVEKAIAKVDAQVAAKIRAEFASLPGFANAEDWDPYFGKLDAKSAEVVRRMKSIKLDKMTFEADKKPGETVVWLFDQIAAKDGQSSIAYTMHNVPGKLEKSIYVSDISAYDALWLILSSSEGSYGYVVSVKDGRMDIWFTTGYEDFLDCQYEVVHDAAAERIFSELEEDGLPKRLNFYSYREGTPPTHHYYRFDGNFSYEKRGERGILRLVCDFGDQREFQGMFIREGMKEPKLLSRKIVARDAVKDRVHVERDSEEEIEKKAQKARREKELEAFSKLLERSTPEQATEIKKKYMELSRKRLSGSKEELAQVDRDIMNLLDMEDDEAAAKSAEVLRRMKAMRLPEISFAPPATLVDAMDFFRTALNKYDSPELPAEKRGVGFVLKLPGDDPKSPAIPTLNAKHISFYDALKLVCDVCGYTFDVKNGLVRIMPKEEPADGKAGK